MNKLPNVPFAPDMQQARLFLDIFGKGEQFTFQILDEGKEKQNPQLTQIRHGSLISFQALFFKLNKGGAGIYVMINEGDGKGRKTENVKRVRALFVDLDGAPLEPVKSCPLQPHIIVETSPGRFHAYWKVHDVTLQEFSDLQRRIAAHFNGDDSVSDLPRVMRIPGFYHNKSEPFLSRIVSQNDAPAYSRDDILGFLHPSMNVEAESKMASAQAVQQGDRNNTLFRIGCSLRDCGMEERDIYAALTRFNNTCVHLPLLENEVMAIAKSAAKYKPGLPPPVPLREATFHAEPYPVDSLGHILGPAVKSTMDATKAPDGLCAQSLLAAATLVTQAHVNIIIAGNSRPISLFFLTLGASGERKSAVDAIAHRPIRRFERRLVEKYRLENEQYKVEKAAFEREARLKSVKAGVRKEPQPPLYPVLTSEDPTCEGLIKTLDRGYPSCGIFSDEAGRFIGGYAMNQDNILKMAAALCSIWEGNRLERVRGSEDPIHLYDRRVSLHLMGQPGVMAMMLGNSILKEQGFLSRMLVSYPGSTIGKRLYSEVNLKTDPAMQLYEQRMSASLEHPLPLRDGRKNELSPRDLHLSAKAMALYIKFHDHVEVNMAADKDYAGIRAFGAKAAEHAVRIAGVLTVLEDIQAAEISQEKMALAISLLDYYLSEAVRLADTSFSNPDIELAEKLLVWAQESGDLVSFADIQQRGPNSLRNKAVAKRIVSILEQHYWFVKVPDGAKGNGRERHDIWVVRK